MAGSIGNEDILTRKPVAPLGLIPLKSIESIGAKVDKFLLEWRAERPIDHLDTVEQQDYAKDSYIINAKYPRFGSGEAKATISDSIRGLDIYILVDVMNYSLTYSMCGQTNHMSPDDHYA
ncbi:MAG: ribose-phosphate pyrophosphokinase, partial [Lachnospiraceae bacterium]|nr:ribose-phosphate pyrophosphokinase [Lachnospiraceae bacterium]